VLGFTALRAFFVDCIFLNELVKQFQGGLLISFLAPASFNQSIALEWLKGKYRPGHSSQMQVNYQIPRVLLTTQNERVQRTN